MSWMLPILTICIKPRGGVHVGFLVDGVMKIVLPLLFSRPFRILHLTWSVRASHTAWSYASSATTPCAPCYAHALPMCRTCIVHEKVSTVRVWNESKIAFRLLFILLASRSLKRTMICAAVHNNWAR
jgi:hypothetical protein